MLVKYYSQMNTENTLLTISGKSDLVEKFLDSEILVPLTLQLSNQLVGKNILFDFRDSGRLTLIKFKHFEYEALEPNIMYCGNVRVLNGISLLKAFHPDENYDNCRDDVADGVTAKLVATIETTHRLDFTLDDEFQTYFPNTHMQTDLNYEVLHAMSDGIFKNVSGSPIVIADENEIRSRLAQVIKPNYFSDYVIPFVEGKSTLLPVPGSCTYREWFARRGFGMFTQQLIRNINHVKQGDFLYVGCSDQVYLLSAVRDKHGSINYRVSAKPSLYFAINYLGFYAWHDAHKPKAPVDMQYVNVAKYRTYDLPGFNGKPYVFPQIGRGQDCKNSCEAHKAMVITGNLDEALAHFKTTYFAEYKDLVIEYARKIHEPHPTEKPNGQWFS